MGNSVSVCSPFRTPLSRRKSCTNRQRSSLTGRPVVWTVGLPPNSNSFPCGHGNTENLLNTASSVVDITLINITMHQSLCSEKVMAGHQETIGELRSWWPTTALQLVYGGTVVCPVCYNGYTLTLLEVSQEKNAFRQPGMHIATSNPPS